MLTLAITLALALSLALPAPNPIRRRMARQTAQAKRTRAKNTQGKRTRAKKMNTVAQGAWGGQHVQLDVTERGASVRYDCGRGAIREPLALDAEGRFDARGVHVRERGGPIRPGQEETGQPARYAGRVEGDTMTLTVTLVESGQSLGTFTLTRGRPGRLIRCL